MKYLFILLIFILVGCSPAYVPNVVNTPLLSEKGELQMNIYTGSSGVDPQLSYAINDEIGVMLNGSFANRTSDSSSNYHKYNFVEMGLGYYTKLSESGRFEVFSGMGYGKYTGEYTNNLWLEYTDDRMYRYFIQPSIGATTDYFDGSFTPRFVMVNMKQHNNKSIGYFVEPTLTGKVGYKQLKFVLQVGLSLPLNVNDLEFSYEPIMFSIGLHSNFNKN